MKVHPISAPQNRPVIDVPTFATLDKLAERYGLLVLHWSRSGVETFVVQDENITYRYRAGAEETTTSETAPNPLLGAEARAHQPDSGQTRSRKPGKPDRV